MFLRLKIQKPLKSMYLCMSGWNRDMQRETRKAAFQRCLYMCILVPVQRWALSLSRAEILPPPQKKERDVSHIVSCHTISAGEPGDIAHHWQAESFPGSFWRWPMKTDKRSSDKNCTYSFYINGKLHKLTGFGKHAQHITYLCFSTPENFFFLTKATCAPLLYLWV